MNNIPINNNELQIFFNELNSNLNILKSIMELNDENKAKIFIKDPKDILKPKKTAKDTNERSKNYYLKNKEAILQRKRTKLLNEKTILLNSNVENNGINQ